MDGPKAMKPLLDRLAREPALVMMALRQIIYLLVAFNVPITEQQQVALLAVGGSLLDLIITVVLRGAVTPNRAVEDAVDIALARAAKDEGGEPIPWEQLKKELDP